jgi:T-complex protein 1 subunit zeta
MLVGGAGQIKITKDGNVLLHEMQIQHPTAMMIARAATAMDDEVGGKSNECPELSNSLSSLNVDGTTSAILFIGELLKQAENFTSEGVHPRLITEGYDIAKDLVLEFLDGFKVSKPNIADDKELLSSVAKASLATKLPPNLAYSMAQAVVDAVSAIRLGPKIPIDLHMIEIMTIEHKSSTDSCFVNGIILDHGARHPDMPRSLKNVYILTCNVSMEYEKSEVSAGFFYSSAEEREKLVDSERRFTDLKVRQIIDFKRKVCDKGQSFAIINQKGIDPVALDMLAKEGIFAARRAKRRNMERLTLACGGVAVNSVEDLDESVLGYAGKLYEETIGEDKYTFVEDVKLGRSCTILIRGPNKHTVEQLKDAVRDGIRAVKCAMEDEVIVPGAGSFEIAASRMLMRRKNAVSGKAKLGIEAYAKSLLVIPKTLAENSGFDVQESILKVEEEQERSELAVGLNLTTGETFLPESEGVWDAYSVKRQILQLSTVLATQLLLVDEVMKAGKSMGKPPANPEGQDDE